MTIAMNDNGISLRRPNKGLTPRLMSLAEDFLDKDMCGVEGAKQAREFVKQAERLDVIVGEDRCG